MNEIITSDGKATIVYNTDGNATVTITDSNNRIAIVKTLEASDCTNCWLDFDFDGTHYTANLFDQPGCWVYPNGDTSYEIPLTTEVYEGTSLIRTN